MTQNAPAGYHAIMWREVKTRVRRGIQAWPNLLYLALVLMGAAFATWGIPSFNRENDQGLDVLGIFVIGVLIPLFADALILIVKKEAVEQAIAGYTMILTIFLFGFALVFSLKTFPSGHASTSSEDGHWKCFALPVLWITLAIALLANLALSGIDPKLGLGPLQKEISTLSDQP